MLLALPVVGFLVAVTGLYVTIEFASVGARRTRIAGLAATGNRAARTLLPVLENPTQHDAAIAACQVGITAASLLLGFYGQRTLAPRLTALVSPRLDLGPTATAGAVVTLVLVTLTALQVVFGELIPKAVALRYPETLALATTWPTIVSMRLFGPFVRILNGTAAWILARAGVEPGARRTHLHSPREIEFLVAESARAGRLDPLERELLQNALDLSELVARQVMIPRNRLDLADASTPVPELLDRLASSPFSRIPVYEGSPDAVVGVVKLKDLFRLHVNGASAIADAVKPVPYVPETASIQRLWQVLILQGNPLAIVIDEYGGTAGIVTQSDLIEEVIGEVRDEFDSAPDRFILRPGEPALVRGDVLVEDVNTALGVDLPLDRADTIAGLLVDRLGRIAQPGDQVTLGGVTLRVEAMDDRAIQQVAILGPRLGA